MPSGSFSQEQTNVAEAYLQILSDRGIRYLFGNGGTDFAPIVEAFARLESRKEKALVPITVPHEMVAMSMAHGYYMVSGEPQLVMLHVSPGTSNAATGIFNAARNNVSVLVAAGRTPINEQGQLGCRDLHIHWGQECFDQAAMVREFVKWDYELRGPEQLQTVLDRALQVSLTEPRGPVYLSLPREILARDAAPWTESLSQHSFKPEVRFPDPAQVEKVAEWIVQAKRPLIVTTSLGAAPEAVSELGALAETWAIPVVVNKSRYVNLPTQHPCHLGFNPHELIPADSSLWEGGADLIIVADSDVPWFPARAQPAADAKVVHLGVDPHFVRYPIRGFRCDAAIPASTSVTLRALSSALAGRVEPATIEERRKRIAGARQALQQRREQKLKAVSTQKPISMIWATHCLSKVKSDEAIVINEYSIDPEFMDFDRPGTNFEQAPSGGLGWALGAALGAKLAVREKDVIVATGDGNYMFCVPLSAHFVGHANRLPFLTVIFNNGSWGAVKGATASMYPAGSAKMAGEKQELSNLTPSPKFEMIVEACGGWGTRVEDPDKLEEALRLALEKVRAGQQAVVNVICA